MGHGQVWEVTIAVILLLQIVSFGASSNSFIPQADAAVFVTYEDPVLGYKIDHPSDWEITQLDDFMLVKFTLIDLEPNI